MGAAVREQLGDLRHAVQPHCGHFHRNASGLPATPKGMGKIPKALGAAGGGGDADRAGAARQVPAGHFRDRRHFTAGSGRPGAERLWLDAESRQPSASAGSVRVRDAA